MRYTLTAECYAVIAGHRSAIAGSDGGLFANIGIKGFPDEL